MPLYEVAIIEEGKDDELDTLVVEPEFVIGKSKASVERLALLDNADAIKSRDVDRIEVLVRDF